METVFMSVFLVLQECLFLFDVYRTPRPQDAKSELML